VQALAFTDGRATSIGSTGESTPRNSPSLGNVAYTATLTWANPSLTRLERQMEVPLFGDNPVEMGVNDRNSARVLSRLRRDARYRRTFRAAFPRSRRPINWTNVVRAISAFQRTITTGTSRYDRYLAGTARLDASETRGMELFFGEKAECHHCHAGLNFSDQLTYAGQRVTETPFHNTGLYNLGGTGAYPEPNRGVFELTGRARDMGAFRAPSLRNVAVTAPYMHDGSMASLQEVVDFYAAGGRVIADGPLAGDGRLNPFKDALIARIELSPQDRADLVAFLGTLTDRRMLTDRRLSNPFRAR
jgi:cytochrome c peroxidase